MLWIPMLVLSYAQNETIFQNKHPKDPTMQNLKKDKKKTTKKVMAKKPLILENTKLVLPNPIRQARSCHGEECWYFKEYHFRKIRFPKLLNELDYTKSGCFGIG